VLRIDEPFHGAVLNGNHGNIADGKLHLTVSGECPAYGQVDVNGVPALIAGSRFHATVPIGRREADITASYRGTYGHQQHTVRVLWDKHSFPRYRFSIDDNSFWLRDVAREQYDSLFDCFYLKMLQRLNTEYGAKFTVNIYFEAQEEFGQEQFFITDFPDRYRGEFEQSADWLGLTFHAYANKPDRPYQYASPDKLMDDMEKVHAQITRFAGEQSLVIPTVIHWGMVLPEALPALYDSGVRVLSGFSNPSSFGFDVNYWLDDVRSEQLWRHDALMDFDSGIAFSRVDIVCNNRPVDEVAPTLAPLADDPNHAEIMDLFTHEQYFWDFYSSYIPDHPQRVETAIRWVTERGYKPVFFHEGFMGAPV